MTEPQLLHEMNLKAGEVVEIVDCSDPYFIGRRIRYLSGSYLEFFEECEILITIERDAYVLLRRVTAPA